MWRTERSANTRDFKYQADELGFYPEGTEELCKAFKEEFYDELDSTRGRVAWNSGVEGSGGAGERPEEEEVSWAWRDRSSGQKRGLQRERRVTDLHRKCRRRKGQNDFEASRVEVC